MDLQEELESNIEKTSDISADLRYLMLQDIGKEGIGQYEQDMAAMGEEDEDLITHTREQPWPMAQKERWPYTPRQPRYLW